MKKRSKALMVATVLATAYALYLVFYFIGGTANADGVGETLGFGLATAMVTPHMVMFFLGAIFGWLGVFLCKPWAALIAAILYSVGTVLFLVYAMYGVPILIFGFIGYAKQAKINKKLAENVQEV